MSSLDTPKQVQPVPSRPSPVRQASWPRASAEGPCRRYNKGLCSSRSCRYDHCCNSCFKGAHSAIECSKDSKGRSTRSHHHNHSPHGSPIELVVFIYLSPISLLIQPAKCYLLFVFNFKIVNGSNPSPVPFYSSVRASAFFGRGLNNYRSVHVTYDAHCSTSKQHWCICLPYLER